jgi:hypothetical protein
MWDTQDIRASNNICRACACERIDAAAIPPPPSIRAIYCTPVLVAVFLALIAGHATADEVDITVDAVVAAGSIAGVSLGPPEKLIVKSLVRCAISGEPLLNCARSQVIAAVPAEIQPVARCIAIGTALQGCAQAQLVQLLPPEVRGIAQCVASAQPIERCAAEEGLRTLAPAQRAVARCVLNGGTPERCAGDALISQLPSPVRSVAQCMAVRVDIGACASAGAGSSMEQTLSVIDKLKADGRSALDRANAGAIDNLVAIANGIKNDEWDVVVLHGGAEVYKIAAKIVLKIVLPPLAPLGPVIDPVIDALVQSRVNLVADVIRGAKRGDVRVVGQAITEVYLVQNLLVPCAVPGIPAEVHEAVCGNLGRVIHALASVGGDALKLAEGLVTDPLGFPDAVWKSTEHLRGVAVGKKNDCMSPAQYYATVYSGYYHRGALTRYQSGTGALDAFSATPNYACRRYYDRCVFSQHFDRLCNPQRNLFIDHSQKSAQAAHRAAQLYMRSFEPFARKKGHFLACSNGGFPLWEFRRNCAAALARQFPLRGHPTRDDGAIAPIADYTPTLYKAACERVSPNDQVSQILKRVCIEERAKYEAIPRAPTSPYTRPRGDGKPVPPRPTHTHQPVWKEHLK